MKSNDLAAIIEEAEGWIGRLKALKTRHEALPETRWTQPTAVADIPAGYTAVDMTTAAAEGFRDGMASVVIDLPKPYPEQDAERDSRCRHYNYAIGKCRSAILDAGGKVKV